MQPNRIKHFTSLTFNEFFSLTCDDFLVSEIEELIADTPLRDDDKRLCVAFYINKMTNQEVADKFSFSLETSKRKRKDLSNKMRETLVKKFFDYENRR